MLNAVAGAQRSFWRWCSCSIAAGLICDFFDSKARQCRFLFLIFTNPYSDNDCIPLTILNNFILILCFRVCLARPSQPRTANLIPLIDDLLLCCRPSETIVNMLAWPERLNDLARKKKRRLGERYLHKFHGAYFEHTIMIYNRYFVTTLTSSGHIGSFIPGAPFLKKIEVYVHLMYLRIYVKFCVIEPIDCSWNCILTK